MTSEHLKSLTSALRHALDVFAMEHFTPDEASSRLVSAADYLIRSAVTHEGTTLMPLAGAYWQEWHDAMEGGAVDAKAFREGALEVERSVSLNLCAEFPPAWDVEDDEDGEGIDGEPF